MKHCKANVTKSIQTNVEDWEDIYERDRQLNDDKEEGWKYMFMKVNVHESQENNMDICAFVSFFGFADEYE